MVGRRALVAVVLCSLFLAFRGEPAIDRDLLYHVQDVDFVNPLSLEHAVLRVRARRDGVSGCSLLLAGRDDPLPMRRLASTARHDLYETRIAVPREGISYAFAVRHGRRDVYFTKYGVYHEPTPHGWWSLAYSHEDVFHTPDWVKNAVFYQIFPERFCNGDRSNDPPGVVAWDARPKLGNFFGGDLQGVLDKLDYLQSLGVNAIYFNPIFEASTNHKYDTTDYMKVDPHFGTTALLKQLVDACHARGMHVILDGVFNHVGTRFWAFQDVLKHGRLSRYASWFHIYSYPVRMRPKPNYACWWGIWELPKLNHHNPEVRRYLLDVATYWIRECGIDGWRLDVPEEVPHSFWVEFRKTVKALRPDAYIVGEIWHDGRPWLRGDQFDAVMNYPLREAIISLLGATTRDGNTVAPVLHSVAAYQKAIHEMMTDLPQQVVQDQFNLLGSHDTERLKTLLGGDDRKVRLAAALLMTAPGAPVVYYGDEVGMEGGPDPDCRRGYPWNGARDLDLLAWYRKLIALRHEYLALRTGEYRTVLMDAERNLYGFERQDEAAALVVLVNPNERTEEAAVSLDAAPPGKLTDLLGDAPVTLRGRRLRARLGPWSAAMVRVR